MTKKSLVPLLLASLVIAPAAHAAVDLIAIGSISGSYEDLSTETTGPLENGIAGNSLGGIGSGLAYTGGNTFLALPDRGPNAKSYNSLVDDTASYINRFQTVNLSLAPSAPGSALPYTLTPFIIRTTLLWSKSPLTYGDGVAEGLGNGAPALNTKHIHYFTGRSDNFDPTKISTNSNNARLDTESIRISSDGESVFISDEYGPYVYEFDRATGQRVRVFALPDKFAVSNLSAQGAIEISNNTIGRVANKGMEGLAITPDGKTLVGILQSPLLQDGGTDSPITRIVTIDIKTGATQEYAYQFDNIGSVAKPKYGTASDIVAINDHEFLVDERDGKGLGDNSTAVVKKLYQIDLTGAQEVSNLSGAASLAGTAVSKTLFLNVVDVLNAHGIDSKDIPAKIEGVAFGPDIVISGVTKHTLFVANDNDFIATVTDANHPAGIDNPNKFFVFAVDVADLPGFTPQSISTFPLLCLR